MTTDDHSPSAQSAQSAQSARSPESPKPPELPGSLESGRAVPVFTIPQPGGMAAELDFTTPGPFSDFALTARITRPDGAIRERTYVAYHSEEAAIFVEILQQWARVATPAGILEGLDRAQSRLGALTVEMEPTTGSENSVDYVLARGIDPLAVLDFLPTDHEHRDERGRVIVLSPNGRDLCWISRRGPRTTFTVPPDHLWLLVVGMVWRSYTDGGMLLTRLSTVDYERALSAFRRAIGKRADP